MWTASSSVENKRTAQRNAQFTRLEHDQKKKTNVLLARTSLADVNHHCCGAYAHKSTRIAPSSNVGAAVKEIERAQPEIDVLDKKPRTVHVVQGNEQRNFYLR